MTTRCRFAPSPTGYLHIGGARTALFNYLFARSSGGQHILRIEDTDRQRSTPEATEAILKSLEWLGIDCDEGPFFQSERTELYYSYARKLLEKGLAYPCNCSAEELEAMREAQRERGEKPQYDRRNRPAEITPQATDLPSANDSEPFVIRLRVPETGELAYNDLILGPVTTPIEEIDDFIIVRSDGSPTYNFTVVVDDIELAITHVIRGMDHVSNTPKQIVIYNALDAATPEFAHVPMILGSDKKKLSKRHGATSVFDYKKEGYLRDGFVNYLARLGWGYGDQEIFTRGELESVFSLKGIGKSDAVFDFEKLRWVNAEHMKQLSVAELTNSLCEVLAGTDGYEEVKPSFAPPADKLAELKEDPTFHKLVASLQERAKTLIELAEQCRWFFTTDEELVLEEKAAQKHLKEKVKEPLSALIDKLAGLSEFDEASIEAAFQQVLEQFELKLVKLAQPVRVAITGSTVSPPIYGVLEILGQESSCKRLRRALEQI